MTRSGVAGQPERPSQFLRPIPIWIAALRDLIRPSAFKGTLLAIFRQVAWLLTACNLPAQLRTWWRFNAREMTAPIFHGSKRPRKSKAPKPF